VCALLATVGTIPCSGQDNPSGFFISWEDRVRDTPAQQPSWPIPAITASSGLLQVARTDFVRQNHTGGDGYVELRQYEGPLSSVPWYRVEFDTLARRTSHTIRRPRMAQVISPSAEIPSGGRERLERRLFGELLVGWHAADGKLQEWKSRSSCFSYFVRGQRLRNASMCSRRRELYFPPEILRNWDVQSCGTPWGNTTWEDSFGRRSKTTQPFTMAAQRRAGAELRNSRTDAEQI